VGNSKWPSGALSKEKNILRNPDKETSVLLLFVHGLTTTASFKKKDKSKKRINKAMSKARGGGSAWRKT